MSVLNRTHEYEYNYMKSSDAKASKCHLKCPSLMMIFLSNLYIYVQ